VTNTLIWAAALFVPSMTLVLGTLGPLRRAMTRWGDSCGKSAAEREAKAALDLAEAAEKRHSTDVHRRAVDAEVMMEEARLGAGTAQYEADAEAARRSLPAAVAARQRALEARAEAEAQLAPELARKALDGSAAEQMASLSQAYAAYCRECDDRPWSFGQWIQGFEGLRA
jgi:hypothetical protein